MNIPSSDGSAKFGSYIACAALVIASLVTGAIAFESRHLPTANMAEILIAVGVSFLPALSTFVVSFFKLFAPASRAHDKWLWFCVGLDLTALLLQGLGVAAREIGSSDQLLSFLNLASYAAAAISALAIAIAAGTSDHRLAHVDHAEGERALARKRLEARLEVVEKDPDVWAELVEDEKSKIRAGNHYGRVSRTPAPSLPAPSAVPFPVTPSMLAQLREMGYPDETANRMTPQQIHRVLSLGLLPESFAASSNGHTVPK